MTFLIMYWHFLQTRYNGYNAMTAFIELGSAISSTQNVMVITPSLGLLN
jgi:hypothetical protein